MFDVGDIYPATVEVVDDTGQPVNPAAVTFTFTLPDGSTVSPTPANPATGRYTYDLVITQAGLHRFRATSTGPATAYADVFSAIDSTWPSVIGLAEAKAHLNMSASDTSSDEELREFLLAVTEVVEHIVGAVVPRQVVEAHDGGTDALTLRKTPVLSVTSVTESGTALDASGYTASLDAGVLYRGAGWSGRWACGRGSVTVTYKAGRSAVPRSVAQAAKELVAVNWRSQQGGNYSPFDSGAETPGGGDVILGFFVPNRVVQMLAPHAQVGGFA